MVEKPGGEAFGEAETSDRSRGAGTHRKASWESNQAMSADASHLGPGRESASTEGEASEPIREESTPGTNSDPVGEMSPAGKEIPESASKHAGDEEAKGEKKKNKKKNKKKRGSARGVETMFRTSYRTHLDLSSLADTKANIMISINGIIISILLASIYPRIVDNRFLLFPTAVLLLFCLLSLVFAVLAARPRVTRHEATLDDVRNDRANILFFGTFTTMGEEDFLQGMGELIEEPERAYRNMVRDIYGLGSVLGKKYRLLRASYTVFMVGLVLGVVLFLGAFTWASGTGGGL